MRATVRRGTHWALQYDYTMTPHRMYRWEVTFPAPYGEFCNRSLLSYSDALNYANETVAKLQAGTA